MKLLVAFIYPWPTDMQLILGQPSRPGRRGAVALRSRRVDGEVRTPLIELASAGSAGQRWRGPEAPPERRGGESSQPGRSTAMSAMSSCRCSLASPWIFAPRGRGENCNSFNCSSRPKPAGRAVIFPLPSQELPSSLRHSLELPASLLQSGAAELPPSRPLDADILQSSGFWSPV